MKRQMMAMAVFAIAALFAVGYGIDSAAARDGGGGGGRGGGGGGGSAHASGGGGGGRAYSGGGGRSGHFSGRSSSGRSFAPSRSFSSRGEVGRRSSGRVYGYRHSGHGHHRHRGRVVVGLPYVYGYSDYSDYGSCGYYYRRAVNTGSSYWWDRYYDCID